MNDHIPKPIDIVVLQNTLAHWLEAPAAPEPAAVIAAAEPAAILDLAAALGRLGQNRALYGRLARRFSDTQDATMARLRSLLTSGDHQGAILLAHTLRGLAGNLGANRLAMQAGELEALLKQANAVPPGLDDRLDEMASCLDQVLAAIAPHASPAPSPTAVPSAPPEDLRGALDRLLDQVDDCDAAAIGEFDKLATSLRQHADGEQVDELGRLIANYDFEAATASLAKIIGGIFR
jgi:HPt (histidine-containing phosphotransfer) domain-containing protein